ncbi:class I SAM-dependent methyltransferase [Iodobacter arcticus]|uniref:Class I SAM-dependent methyltransferase n=1 Tax=Iodobacter arcticus TaxID=590593 RepID=A0ABW2QX91_9NEIS
MPLNVDARLNHFADWLATPLGHYLASAEMDWYDRTVTDIFGYKAVQLELPQLDCLRANRMAWRLHAGQSAGVALRCMGEALPFANQSIDLLILPHVLDFAANPQAVLREAERVLMPEGRLLITGFNPWSLWGLRRLKNGVNPAPWRGNFVALPRLKDWLSLLGFETIRGEFLCYGLPVQREKWLSRSRFLEDAGDRWWPAAGGVYCLDMVKRVHGMRLIGPKWRTVPAVAGAVTVAGVDKSNVLEKELQPEKTQLKK